MGAPVPVEMEGYLRQQQKKVALGERRGNPFPRITTLEEEMVALGQGLAFSRANRVRNPDWRVNQRGYVSGAALPPQQYGPDGWCASGRVNPFRNPRFGAAGATTTDWTAGIGGGGSGTFSQSAGASGGPTASCPTYRRFTMTSAHVPPLVVSNAGVFGANGVVMPSSPYMLSVWVRSSAAATVYLDALIYNQDGTLLLDTTQVNVVLVANTWTRLTHAITTPRGATYLSARILTAANLANGVTLDITGLMMDPGANVIDYFDGASAGSSWAGTAHASISYSVTAAGSITLPAAAQGGLATLSSGMRIFQPIERANLPAGEWLFDQPGTAQGRVYNAGTAPGSRPAFADFPIPFTCDGLDTVIVEAQATGGSRTFGEVQLLPTDVPQLYVPRPLSEELLLAQREYVRYSVSVSGERFAYGFQPNTTIGECTFFLPVDLRVEPVVTTSSIYWTDGVSYNATVTGFYVGGDFYNAGKSNRVSVAVRFAAAGTGRWPGALSAISASSYIEFDARQRAYAL